MAETTPAFFTARLEPDGAVFAAPALLPLLQAAERAGVALADSSCRNGTCRTCRAIAFEKSTGPKKHSCDF
jgi:ferredoxin